MSYPRGIFQQDELASKHGASNCEALLISLADHDPPQTSTESTFVHTPKTSEQSPSVTLRDSSTHEPSVIGSSGVSRQVPGGESRPVKSQTPAAAKGHTTLGDKAAPTGAGTNVAVEDLGDDKGKKAIKPILAPQGVWGQQSQNLLRPSTTTQPEQSAAAPANRSTGGASQTATEVTVAVAAEAPTISVEDDDGVNPARAEYTQDPVENQERPESSAHRGGSVAGDKLDTEAEDPFLADVTKSDEPIEGGRNVSSTQDSTAKTDRDESDTLVSGAGDEMAENSQGSGDVNTLPASTGATSSHPPAALKGGGQSTGNRSAPDVWSHPTLPPQDEEEEGFSRAISKKDARKLRKLAPGPAK